MIGYLRCAKTLSLSPDEIIEIVGQEKIKELKQFDPAPMLKAYVLATEGIAHPEVHTNSGDKPTFTEWTKSAIKQIAQKVQAGITKLFIGHTGGRGPDFAQASKLRPNDAEIVGTRYVEGDPAHTILVAYYKPEKHKQAETLNAVSIEVEFEAAIEKTKNGIKYIVERINDVFGVALLPDGTKPAFETAKTVGVAFANYQDDSENLQKKQTSVKMEKRIEDFTFEELRHYFVDVRKARLWQLFSAEHVFGRAVKKDGRIEYVDGDRDVQRFIQDQIDDARSEWEKDSATKIAALEARIKELEPLQSEVKKYHAVPTIEKKLAEGKYPAPVIAAVKSKIGEFMPGDDLEASAQAFIDKEKQAYEFYVKHLKPRDEQIPLTGGEPAPEQPDNFGVDDA